MKCEICHKADAETALVRGEGPDEEELYVCKACAAAERKNRQKKSQRTRRVTGLPPGMSMSITEIKPAHSDDESGDASDESEVPPFIESIMDAFSGIASDIEKLSKNADASEKKQREKKYHLMDTGCVEAKLRIGRRLHLEGLYLVGDLQSVKRAFRALDMELESVTADEVREAGHVYSVRHANDDKQADLVVYNLLREERNARHHLLEHLPRVYGDTICRALATLKNCRLLSPGELFDLLSPLRLAALDNLLDGITVREIESMMKRTDLTSAEDKLDQSARDDVDAERADEMNRRFADVVLNERAEEKYL